MIAFIFLLFSTSSFALTVDQALNAAYSNSHEVKGLQLEAEANTWGEKKAFASFLPQLNLSGRHLIDERFEELPVEFGGQSLSMAAIQPYTMFTLSASYELFGGFQSTNELNAAHLEKTSTAHKITRANELLTANIRTIFYRALGSQVLVDVADKNIKTLEGHLHDVDSRIRSGVSTRFDSLRIEVQLEDARTEKIAALDNVAINRAKLFEAIGIADDGKSLAGQLPEEFSKYEDIKINLNDLKREDRMALVYGIEKLQNKGRAQNAHWYPKISVFAAETLYNSYNRAIWQDNGTFKPAYSLGLAFSWNLFDGGASFASQKQAALASQIAAEKLAGLDLNIPVEIEEAKRKLSYNIINYKAKQGTVRKAQEAVRLAQAGLRAGSRTNTEVLDAVVDLNRAKASSVKSQIDTIEALGQLELATGHSF